MTEADLRMMRVPSLLDLWTYLVALADARSPDGKRRTMLSTLAVTVHLLRTSPACLFGDGRGGASEPCAAITAAFMELTAKLLPDARDRMIATYAAIHPVGATASGWLGSPSSGVDAELELELDPNAVRRTPSPPRARVIDVGGSSMLLLDSPSPEPRRRSPSPLALLALEQPQQQQQPQPQPRPESSSTSTSTTGPPILPPIDLVVTPRGMEIVRYTLLARVTDAHRAVLRVLVVVTAERTLRAGDLAWIEHVLTTPSPCVTFNPVH